MSGTLSTFMTIARWIIFRMRNVSDKVVDEIKIHIFCPVIFFRKSCRLWENVGKYGGATEAADDNMATRYMLINKATRAQAHACTRAPTPHARRRTHSTTHTQTNM